MGKERERERERDVGGQTSSNKEWFVKGDQWIFVTINVSLPADSEKKVESRL
jgi:hypothetical protein